MDIVTPGCASREPQLQAADGLREISNENDGVGLQSHSLE